MRSAGLAFWVGVGIELMANAGPQVFPDAPDLVWAILFWFGAAIIVGAVLWGIISFLKERRSGDWVSTWSVNAVFGAWLPFYRRIPLSRAADIAYKKTQNSRLAELFEHWAREKDQGRDYVLENYASYLVGHGEKMEVWGVRPPSDRVQKIDSAEFVSGIYGDSGDSFIPTGGKAPKWKGLRVLKSSLKQRIKDIREGVD